MILPSQISHWPEGWKYLFEERAGILEYLADFDRKHAEIQAEKDIRFQASLGEGEAKKL